MKKLFKIIIFIILINYSNVYATTSWQLPNKIIRNKQTPILKETITSITNNSITFKITIPKECNLEKLIISPDIFETLNHYKILDVNNPVKITIIIDNKSKQVYKYKKDSLLISTPDYQNDVRFQNTGAISFAKESIVTKFIPPRIINNAIINLYNTDEEINVQNDILNTKLKSKGYLGISQLDKYFLDYYNAKYNLNFSNLNSYNNQVIDEIFTGKEVNIQETNNNIIALSYNYYFNELLKVQLNNTYTIGEGMHYYLDDTLFIDSFNYIDIKSTPRININILLDDNYTNIFKNYLSGHLEFTLEKSIYINPPDTGI